MTPPKESARPAEIARGGAPVWKQSARDRAHSPM